MSKIKCVVGGTLIGAGGIYVGFRMTCHILASIVARGGEEKVDEVLRIFKECSKLREQPR